MGKLCMSRVKTKGRDQEDYITLPPRQVRNRFLDDCWVKRRLINVAERIFKGKTMRKSVAILLIVALTVAMMFDQAENTSSGRRRRRIAGVVDRQKRTALEGDDPVKDRFEEIPQRLDGEA
ncbi:uncharacterized protein LOC144869674 isoform X1 [Branchiostoma floridae x Branchiostoma japonicum]